MSLASFVFNSVLKISRLFKKAPIPEGYEKQELPEEFIDHRNPNKLTGFHKYGDVNAWALFYMVYDYYIIEERGKYFLLASKYDMQLFKDIWMR